MINKLKYIVLSVFLLSDLFAGSDDSLLVVWKNTAKHDTVRAMAMHKFSRSIVFNHPDSTLELSQQLYEFCNAKGLVKFKIGAINNIAIAYYVKGEYERSIDEYGKSIFLLKGLIKDKTSEYKNFAKNQLGKTYGNVGNVYLDKGDYPRALDFYFESLKLVQEMGDKRAESVAYTNVGIIYGIQKNYDTSIGYFFKSLVTDSLMGDKMGVANNYSNIGNLYQEKLDLKNSLVYQQKSLELRREINDMGGVTLSLLSLGSLNHQFAIQAETKGEPLEQVNGFYKAALEFYQQGLKIAVEIGDKNNEAVALMGLGKSEIKLGNANSGITFCEKSLSIAESIQANSEIRDACDCLYNGYSKIKNTGKALFYFEKYISIRDTLNSADKIREIAQKQFEFDYTKKAAADSLRTLEQRLVIQAELKNEQTRRYFLYGGLALVIVFAGFMFNRFKITQKQKSIIEKQKTVVEEKQKEILDSIQYAKRIQKTLLAHESFLNTELKSYFILYKPKDIVSGDFYWATKKDHNFYLAVCDSTGHGVPGAFMSLLNATLLNEAITEKNIIEPGEVFNYVRSKIIVSMSAESQKDGMDGVLIKIDTDNGNISYAAANNKPLLISDAGLKELPQDKMPIGLGERKEDFKTYKLDYAKGNMLYLFTDGYADQFGGEKGKKFKYRQLEEFLLEIEPYDLEQKRAMLDTKFENWRSGLEQVDDVTIVGIRL